MIGPLNAVFFGKQATTWLQISPGACNKGRFVTLACKKLTFCLVYEVNPRIRSHISSLSTKCGTGARQRDECACGRRLGVNSYL